MAIQSLAIKYRPAVFDDVVAQEPIKKILQHQLKHKQFQHAYLFCGGAGTGKTTCARIFAKEINNHKGVPIEIDAASNSGVDDVREIIRQAKTQSLDSEFKIFILDEVHSLSNTAWQALLKLIEEPPAKTIFIFCTTDPQKIPRTILSRVQRYDFARIPTKQIENRLKTILDKENLTVEVQGSFQYEAEALEYLAKLSEGGMRDAITYMDKCLAFSPNLTVSNVLAALGTADYDTMFRLFSYILNREAVEVITLIGEVHMSGVDLKQFIKSFMAFVLDINIYAISNNIGLTSLPSTYANMLLGLNLKDTGKLHSILSAVIRLSTDIKWEVYPKPVIESQLLLLCVEEIE